MPAIPCFSSSQTRYLSLTRSYPLLSKGRGIMNFISDRMISARSCDENPVSRTRIPSKCISSSTFLKPLEGSVRDVKSLRNVLDEIHFNCILVLDTGFSSQDLAEIMRSDMKFVMPLRRNHDMIYYSMDLRSSFV